MDHDDQGVEMPKNVEELLEAAEAFAAMLSGEVVVYPVDGEPWVILDIPAGTDLSPTSEFWKSCDPPAAGPPAEYNYARARLEHMQFEEARKKHES